MREWGKWMSWVGFGIFISLRLFFVLFGVVFRCSIQLPCHTLSSSHPACSCAVSACLLVCLPCGGTFIPVLIRPAVMWRWMWPSNRLPRLSWVCSVSWLDSLVSFV
ncbi:hypothetical protein BC567DRAFT_239483 [Phyllosticta citribraziliensis]